MASPVRADGDAQVEQPVEAAPAASGDGESAAPEAPVGGTSTTLTTFPFKNEDLLRVQASRLQEANLGKAELSADLFARSSLLELKSEAARWHSASNQVEKDLGTLGALVSALQIQATNEGSNEESTLVKEGPLTGRSLSQVVRVQEANKNRLQILRDGENLYSFSYFSKYVSVDEGSLPSFVGDIRDGNRDAVLDVIRWTTQKMSESQESVRSMTTFLSALDAHLKVTEEAHAETSRRLIELAGAIVGVQSATRLTVDDAKQSQRQTHRTLENMLWQLAGPGKAANQSVKDVLISSAKMVQQVEQHLAKNARIAESTAEIMENMENHLSATSDHLKKLVELQSRSTRAEEAKASAKLPPPPVAPDGCECAASDFGNSSPSCPAKVDAE